MGGSIPGKGRSAFIHSAVGQIQSVWVKHHCNTYSLRNSIVPVIVDKDFKLYYYRELEGWEHERGFLRDTCLMAQDKFKKYLAYFRVP